MHPDKGNGIVLSNRSDYIKSMTKHINDNKKVIKLKNHPTIKREQALQRTLRKLNKKNIFNESEYSDLLILIISKEIIITPLDKGNGIFVLNRSGYIKSMTELINDKKNL